MKKLTRILSLALALCMVACLFGCGPQLPPASSSTQGGGNPPATGNPTTGTTKPVDQLVFTQGTILRMATGYNSAKTGLFFDAEIAKDGITLADGKTYNTGSLKPTWVEVQNRLGMIFENKYQGNSATKEFEYWKDRLSEVDIQGLFSREDDNNQRRVDMMRFCGTLFGVRGLESRQDYLYVGADGKLHDARQEADTYEALERMNAMAQEGLISQSFMNASDEDTSTMLENDLGFMHYDYNQTQTVYNETKLNKDGDSGEKYMAVMVPVAGWIDNTEGKVNYMRFTESWRSVKTDGWAISKAGVGNDQNKLYAALKLIDYAYSPEGQILMSYGPDEFIKKNSDGSYATFNFNGKQMPVIADATFDELWEKAAGNYTNYARQYLGSTLSFVKSQAFEYQCTHAVGKEGAGYISTAIGLGTIKHPELGIASNPWYTSIPTVLPHSTTDNDQINSYKELKDNFSTSKNQVNLLVDQIVEGYAAYEGVSNAQQAADKVANDWSGKLYLAIKQRAYQQLLNFYDELN